MAYLTNSTMQSARNMKIQGSEYLHQMEKQISSFLLAGDLEGDT